MEPTSGFCLNLRIFGGPVPLAMEVALSAIEQAESYPCPWADFLNIKVKKIRGLGGSR